MCLLALGAGALPAGAQTAASFQGLGQMPGALYGTYAGGVSGNGAVVVGYGWVSSSQKHAFRWSAVSGYQLLGDLGGGESEAMDASQDGSVVVGQSLGADGAYHAFRWTPSAGMQTLPIYAASAVNADGSVVVGMNVRWVAPGTINTFGFLGGNNYTSALNVSADGQVVVGYSETSPNRYVHAFRWTPTSGIRDLGVTTGTESIGRGVSGNGLVVVGEARDRNQYWRAFKWTASTGMRDMGTLGGPMSAAYEASHDGTVIVGKSLSTSWTSSERAFRWTTKRGMQDLKKELQALGIHSLDSWTLFSAVGVSDDGTVIVGYGLNPNGQWEPFRAVLPIPQ